MALFPQRCKLCGKADGFNFNIDDDVWKQVVPKEYVNRVLCLPCFDCLASLRGVDYSNAIDKEVHFVGRAAYLTFEVRFRESAEGCR